MKILCCLSVFALLSTAWVSGWIPETPSSCQSTCSNTVAHACSEACTLAAEYSKSDLKVIQTICDHVVSSKSFAVDPEAITKSTGVNMMDRPIEYWRPGVLEELKRREFDLNSCATANRCTDYGACSVYGNLASATGDQLQKYTEEKKRDGLVIDPGADLPEFSLTTTDGSKVDNHAIDGKLTAFVFLATHCGHSWKTLPIIEQLGKDNKDIRFLPIYVNVESNDELVKATAHLNLTLPLAARADDALAKEFGATLVPSIFLVDANGKIRRQFVGFKTQEEIQNGLTQLAQVK